MRADATSVQLFERV